MPKKPSPHSTTGRVPASVHGRNRSAEFHDPMKVTSHRTINPAVSVVDHGNAMAIATAHQSEALLRESRPNALNMYLHPSRSHSAGSNMVPMNRHGTIHDSGWMTSTAA